MIDAKQYFTSETLKDGTPVVVRAIRSSDRSAVLSAFKDLDRESIFTRFFTYKKGLSDHDLHAITDVDFNRVVALVLTTTPENGGALIGGGRYAGGVGSASSESAELAFICSETWRGRGVASLLMKHLVRIGRERGLLRLEAHVLPQNGFMLTVFRHSGLPMTADFEGGTIHVHLSLSRVT